MKIEVGKKYRTREGRVVTAKEINPNRPETVRLAVTREDGDTEYYCQDGYYYSSRNECQHDLVAEVDDEQPKPKAAEPEAVDMPAETVATAPAPMQLQVGKRYRTRDGEIVTINSFDEFDGSAYPFIGSNGQAYTPTGNFYADDDESSYDLVAEIVDEVPSADVLEVAEHAVEQVEAGGCAPPVLVNSEHADEPHPVEDPELNTAPDFEFVEIPPHPVAERPADIEAIDEIGATMLRLKHRMSGREQASVVAWFSARYD